MTSGRAMKTATIKSIEKLSIEWQTIHSDGDLTLGRQTFTNSEDRYDVVVGLVRDMKASGYKVRTRGFGRIS